MNGIIAKKLGMTTIFGEDGSARAVTVLEAGPNPVVAKRTVDEDGYNAVQLAADPVADRKVSRAELGHLKTANVGAHRILQEVRDMTTDAEIGDTVDVTQFEEGAPVKVIGTSAGKGFAGTIKRHNFSRGPVSHGSHNVREPGSIGASAYPAKVVKGKRMPGRLGGDTVTQRGLSVARVDADRNLLLVTGSVPGRKGGHVLVVSE